MLLSLCLLCLALLGRLLVLPRSHRSCQPHCQALAETRASFLITAADDGSRVVYFIAENTRHNILGSDLLLEQQLNPLWPVRSVSREEVLAFSESAPIGKARPGMVSAPVDAASADDETASPVMAEAPSLPVAEDPSPVVAEEPSPVVAEEPSAPTAIDQSVVVEPTTYVLQRGDDLTHISRRFGTTVEAILAANGIADPNRIYFGLSLVIPGSAPDNVAEAPVEPAPIAEAAPQPVADAPATPAPTAEEPQPVADVPANEAVASTYTVKPGDSAISIARRFGVDVDQLLAENTVTNRNRVLIGQVLTIPAA